MGFFNSIWGIAKNSIQITTKSLESVNDSLNKFNSHLSILNFEKKINVYFSCLKYRDVLSKHINEFNPELWESTNRFRKDDNKISGKDKLNELKKKYIESETDLKETEDVIKQMAYDLYGTEMLSLTVEKIRDYHYKNR